MMPVAKMLPSGGGPHQGGGIVVSQKCWALTQDVWFHAYSPRVCSLTFRLANKDFVACACYMPTSWDTDEAVMQMYKIWDLILYSRACVNRLLLLDGGFNASIHREGSHGLDLEHHLQGAPRAFYANKSIVCGRQIPQTGARHCGSSWRCTFLHEWNARVLECTEQSGVKLWSRRFLERHWKLPNYIAKLPEYHWLKHALAWTRKYTCTADGNARENGAQEQC